ncbi:hypothetical protein niasHT_025963 [Heterodera trifolii]|uniref:Protein SHQ1 homolog n=1 Tax=Heterodera trifolii TaxID=157864 RepID=A0ABD2J4F3_9BILA
MLTPLFRVAQDDRFLLLTIRAPHCSLRGAELSYDGRTFLFHAKPYFLRLFLPADVVDDESGTCEYDAEEVPKKTPGEHFARLEMLTELLRPQEPNAQRLVEELDGGEDEFGGGNDSIDCFAQQSLPKDWPATSSSAATALFGYGFGWQRHAVLGRLLADIGQGELPIDLEDPDGTSIDDRLECLNAFDADHFRPEHYLADLHEPDQAQLDVMEFDPFQHKDSSNFALSDQDRADLKDLPRRKLPHFAREAIGQIVRSLVDILFGFLYDFRTTLGEHSVESGWTCSHLAPSLAFLLRWPSTREALRCTVRHSLVVPLFRNWSLSLLVCRDVCAVFKIGPVAVLHCLLTVRRLFNRGDEFRYMFNQLFMDELCLWVQSVPEEVFEQIGSELETELDKLSKADMTELELDTIELEAKMALLNPVDSDDEEEEEEEVKKAQITSL